MSADLESEGPRSERLTAKAAPGRIQREIHEAVRRELEFFSGPLPPPHLLIEYNKVYPECGKEIVQMARDEQRHRHQTEEDHVRGDITLAKRGQLIGGILALAAVVGAIYLIAHDKPISGLSVLSGVVIAFGGPFIYDRYQRARASTKPKGRETQEMESNLPGQTLSESEETRSATQN